MAENSKIEWTDSSAAREIAAKLSAAQKRFIRSKFFYCRAFRPPLLFVAREVVSLGLMQRLSGEGVDPMSFGPLPLGLTVRSILEGRE